MNCLNKYLSQKANVSVTSIFHGEDAYDASIFHGDCLLHSHVVGKLEVKAARSLYRLVISK